MEVSMVRLLYTYPPKICQGSAEYKILYSPSVCKINYKDQNTNISSREHVLATGEESLIGPTKFSLPLCWTVLSASKELCGPDNFLDAFLLATAYYLTVIRF
jgi:hypothetical protein